MRETGIVTELNGNMAVLKVMRKVPTGCGCGNSVTIEEIRVEVKNNCAAKLGDQVAFGSTHDESRFRHTARAFVSVSAFLAGFITGEAIFPRLGISFPALVSGAIGVTLAVIPFLIITRHYKKNPLPAQAAYSIV